MKRSNEAESDHRNIMTPEFRAFCVSSREHAVCCAAFLAFFVGSYAVVSRACMRGRASRGPSARREARRLAVPYATVFRSRQVSLVMAAAGLASASMTAVLVAVTVGLANAMEHGDPHSLPSWRTWLLPATLLVPGDSRPGFYAGSMAAGPQAAHDFPPILRRLWLYESLISVGTAVFVVPLGLLFEGVSRRAPAHRRLFTALVRWLAIAAAIFVVWEVACRRFGYLHTLGLYRPFSPSGATFRYSVHYATCVFGLLPLVIAIMPRGTWAMFSWLWSCVGQSDEAAAFACQRYTRLLREKSRIEARLRQAIGSWRWEQFHDTAGMRSFEDLGDLDPSPQDPSQERGLPSRASTPRLPPAHPGLARQPDGKGLRMYQTVAARRPRGSPRKRPGIGKLLSATSSPVATERPPLPLDGATSPHSPILYYSDGADTSDDCDGSAQAQASARRAQRRLQRAREREMQEISRRIKKYHAQLLLVRDELCRIERSGFLETAARSSEGRPPAATGYSSILPRLMATVRRGCSLLAMAAAAFCWLLLVLQIGRGALSAIFIGEPDLTSSFTYFFPALLTADPKSLGLEQTSHGQPAGDHVQDDPVSDPAILPAPALAPLVTACQLISSALLFIVVLFGVLSMGTSVEDSVHPVRAVVALYAEKLLCARQWEWLPRVLLPNDVLADLDPTSTAQKLASRSEPRLVVDNMSRGFFSSSADLTSYYRQLLRQSASTAALSAKFDDATLSESTLQTTALGRRVFLPFSRHGRQSQPVPMRRMLAYVWIVCGLAMSWPSVLRTTGLISQRAYILPVASLVEPLWSPYVLEEELVLQPVRRPEVPPASAAPPDVVVPTMEHCPATPLTDAFVNGSPGWAASLACIMTPTSAEHTATSETDPAAVSVEPSLEHRISRRALLESLSADTLPRVLVRWALELAKGISSHLSITLAYAVWWTDPDLIAPLSAATVDAQLGYVDSVPVRKPVAAFGVTPEHSEWYGMLRRLEQKKVRLPQEADGTPLVLHPAAGASGSPDSEQTPSDGSQPADQTVLGAVYNAAVYVWERVCTTAERAWAAILARAGAVAKIISRRLQSSSAGRRLAWVGYQSMEAFGLAWDLLRSLLQHMSLALSGLLRGIALAASYVSPGTPGWTAHSSFSEGGSSLISADGIGSTVPSIFLAEYWDAVTMHGRPAFQRLRPELWPHILGGDTADTPYIYAAMPPSQPVADAASDSGPDVYAADGPGASGGATTTTPSDEAQAQAAEGGPRVREVWTAMDWLLAAYRVALGILALRVVFGPLGSSRPLLGARPGSISASAF
ncbi:hypothetical protein GGF46_003348 [Coemansia sp. RSA 552]|nr:hypothetical protein GGF46_003348 [Coemansia sp. RSA 552]